MGARRLWLAAGAPEYKDVLHVYNENVTQQRDKTSTGAGGGNAIARPKRASGASIGMPTGDRGGFIALDEPMSDGNGTAMAAIVVADQLFVDHVTHNPGRFRKIYYVVNNPTREPDERKDLIDMGIFNIERNCRVYITDTLKELKHMIAKRAIENRRKLVGG
jgi:hypothetical protein